MCARHLFSFPGPGLSSPAGREMSCRDAIVGHSASREWTAEIQSRFSFYFLAQNPQSPLWPDSKAGEGWLGMLCWSTRRAPRWPGCTWSKRRLAALLRSGVLCSRRENASFHGSAPFGFGGEEAQSAFQLRKSLTISV